MLSPIKTSERFGPVAVVDRQLRQWLRGCTYGLLIVRNARQFACRSDRQSVEALIIAHHHTKLSRIEDLNVLVLDFERFMYFDVA